MVKEKQLQTVTSYTLTFTSYKIKFKWLFTVFPPVLAKVGTVNPDLHPNPVTNKLVLDAHIVSETKQIKGQRPGTTMLVIRL